MRAHCRGGAGRPRGTVGRRARRPSWLDNRGTQCAGHRPSGRGNLCAAEDAFRRSLQASEHFPLVACWAHARLGLVLVSTGRLTEAADHVRRALAATLWSARTTPSPGSGSRFAPKTRVSRSPASCAAWSTWTCSPQELPWPLATDPGSNSLMSSPTGACMPTVRLTTGSSSSLTPSTSPGIPGHYGPLNCPTAAYPFTSSAKRLT